MSFTISSANCPQLSIIIKTFPYATAKNWNFKVEFNCRLPWIPHIIHELLQIKYIFVISLMPVSLLFLIWAAGRRLISCNWIGANSEENPVTQSGFTTAVTTLRWRHNDGLSNHQPHDCLLNRLFRYRSRKTSKLRVTGLCAGNSPVTSECPAKKVSDADNVSTWWRHHVWFPFQACMIPMLINILFCIICEMPFLGW